MEQGEIVRVSRWATKSSHDRMLVIDDGLLRAKAADASSNPRKREIHVLNSGEGDNLQRFLNALQPGTYIRPHRHLTPPKAESIVLLQGAIACVAFSDNGEPDLGGAAVLFHSNGTLAADIREGVWHTFISLEPDTVIFEVKAGPYDAQADKGFAPWAPEEGSGDAVPYLVALEDRLRGYWHLGQRHWR